MKLKPAIKERWTAALRSGRYPQGRLNLRAAIAVQVCALVAQLVEATGSKSVGYRFESDLGYVDFFVFIPIVLLLAAAYFLALSAMYQEAIRSFHRASTHYKRGEIDLGNEESRTGERQLARVHRWNILERRK